MPQSDDARPVEVGPAHSTGEAPNKAVFAAAEAVREGRGQGQCDPEQHAPDPELGKRIPGNGPHTSRRKAG